MPKEDHVKEGARAAVEGRNSNPHKGTIAELASGLMESINEATNTKAYEYDDRGREQAAKDWDAGHAAAKAVIESSKKCSGTEVYPPRSSERTTNNEVIAHPPDDTLMPNDKPVENVYEEDQVPEYVKWEKVTPAEKKRDWQKPEYVIQSGFKPAREALLIMVVIALVVYFVYQLQKLNTAITATEALNATVKERTALQNLAESNKLLQDVDNNVEEAKKIREEGDKKLNDAEQTMNTAVDTAVSNSEANREALNKLSQETDAHLKSADEKRQESLKNIKETENLLNTQ